jgi:cobalamin synthase
VTRGPTSASVLSLLLALVAAVVTAGWTYWASWRLGGGLTGDTYGALNELVSLAVLASLPSILFFCARF